MQHIDFSLNLRSDLTVPKIVKPNEVLVRIHAASIDLIDIALLSGLGRIEQTLFKCRNESPKVLGRDFSGVVLDVGRNVSHLEVGDQCWSAIPLAVHGSLSEFIVMEAKSVRLKPAHLSHDGAATLPYSSLIGKIPTYLCKHYLFQFSASARKVASNVYSFSVWNVLTSEARIKPDYGLRNKRILIVDGGSPTGCIAIQVHM